MLATRLIGAIVGLAAFAQGAAYRCTNGGSFYCCANSGPFSSCNPGTASLGCAGTGAQYPVCCLGPGYSCTFAQRADNCACPPVYNCPC